MESPITVMVLHLSLSPVLYTEPHLCFSPVLSTAAHLCLSPVLSIASHLCLSPVLSKAPDQCVSPVLSKAPHLCLSPPPLTTALFHHNNINVFPSESTTPLITLLLRITHFQRISRTATGHAHMAANEKQLVSYNISAIQRHCYRCPMLGTSLLSHVIFWVPFFNEQFFPPWDAQALILSHHSIQLRSPVKSKKRILACSALPRFLASPRGQGCGRQTDGRTDERTVLRPSVTGATLNTCELTTPPDRQTDGQISAGRA